MSAHDPRRRRALVTTAGLLLAVAVPRLSITAVPMISRRVPATGESWPAVGLGTWQAFDVEPGSPEAAQAAQALSAFTAGGGRVIDSSPMYGRAEAVLGSLQEAGKLREALLLATKIWTRGREDGIAQLANSHRLLRAPVLDLVQVHNLLGARAHLQTLRAAREEGTVRLIGITHWTASAHAELADWIVREPLDVLQVNYSLAEAEAGARLLDLAADRGLAVLINRPLAEGALIRRTVDRPLPAWAVAQGVASWAQFCLKWILGHPAVTCVLVGTRNPRHVADNLDAARGWLPDAAERERMRADLAALPG